MKIIKCDKCKKECGLDNSIRMDTCVEIPSGGEPYCIDYDLCLNCYYGLLEVVRNFIKSEGVGG